MGFLPPGCRQRTYYTSSTGTVRTSGSVSPAVADFYSSLALLEDDLSAFVYVEWDFPVRPDSLGVSGAMRRRFSGVGRADGRSIPGPAALRPAARPDCHMVDRG